MNQKLRTLWLQLKAEGKKAAILGALAVVCLVLLVRGALMGKQKPGAKGPATAAQPVAGSAAPGAETPAVNTTPLDLSPPKRYAKGGTPARDLYALNPKFFPDVGAVRGVVGEAGAKSAIGIDDKSVEAAPPEAEVTRHRALADASRLRVRSVMVGAQPAAVIERDDEGVRKADVVRLRETVAGFLVAEITAAGVRLERDGVEVTLEVAVKKK